MCLGQPTHAANAFLTCPTSEAVRDSVARLVALGWQPTLSDSGTPADAMDCQTMQDEVLGFWLAAWMPQDSAHPAHCYYHYRGAYPTVFLTHTAAGIDTGEWRWRDNTAQCGGAPEACRFRRAPAAIQAADDN